MKQFSLMDDMTFTDDGRPADSGGNPAAVSGGAIERQGRYSWAYMFQRVRNNSLRTQADISIIVYSGRSLDVPTDENAFYALSQPGSRLTDAGHFAWRMPPAISPRFDGGSGCSTPRSFSQTAASPRRAAFIVSSTWRRARFRRRRPKSAVANR